MAPIGSAPREMGRTSRDRKGARAAETRGDPAATALATSAGGLSLVAVAVGLGLFSGLDHSKVYRAEFSTRLGEHRQVALPDGSLIDLNSGFHSLWGPASSNLPEAVVAIGTRAYVVGKTSHAGEGTNQVVLSYIY